MNQASLKPLGDADGAPVLAHFRRAGPEDAEAVARVHFEAARQAYRGVLPDAELDEMTYERRLALWGGMLGEAGRMPCVELVVEGRSTEAGEVIAFAWWRPLMSGQGRRRAEIVHIYVMPECQRRGLGRRLMARIAQDMAEAGLESCYLWVFEAHQAARGFYEALGGRLIDRDWEIRGELRVPIVAYAWSPLGILATQGDRPAVRAQP